MTARIRGLAAALNSNGRFKYKAPEFVVDHLVIGAGVVGLAVAQRLAAVYPHKTTYIVERNERVGEETSSRNSEVIHAGLYYPPDSLKTRLCLLGRKLLYDFCDAEKIPYRKTGKLVVATEDQRGYIENLHLKAKSLHWPSLSISLSPDTSCSSYPVPTYPDPALPTQLLDTHQLHALEPNLSPKLVAALFSPETGIVDSHTLMQTLEKHITESEGGELICSTRVVRIDPYKPAAGSSATQDDNGWVVQMVTSNADSSDAVLAHTVINATGLSGPFLSNALVPKSSRTPMYYARGSYASYRGPGVSGISHLIYPCPETGSNAHAFQSLGTHLTLDLQGKIRFGPDIEWISPPLGGSSNTPHDPDTVSVEAEESVDFWKNHLVPSEERLEEMHGAVTRYLPDVELEGFQPDYVGIRPKLVPPGGGFQDFVFKTEYADTNRERNQMISLLGIESPGLTSSLAIGRVVSNMIGERRKDS
ncbi:hypothetical protein HGRIS_009249 [Hohenbuehelia grisea]|uniref:L-2-hydroxyglutarate dehydrogenase, mitochondrial n=1 Tax=Hohenbuehelia grisea TaxID=104357 RepID=A0ABR3J0R5_9AGAR